MRIFPNEEISPNLPLNSQNSLEKKFSKKSLIKYILTGPKLVYNYSSLGWEVNSLLAQDES